MCSRKSDNRIWACLNWWRCKWIRKYITWTNISFVLICKEKSSSLNFKKHCKKVAFKFIDYVFIIYLTNSIPFANQCLIDLHHALSNISKERISWTSKMSKSLNILFNLTSLSIWTRSWRTCSCCLSWFYDVWLCWLRCYWFNWLKLNWTCIYRLCWWNLSILCSLSIWDLLRLWECDSLCLLIRLIRSRRDWLSWNI